MSEYVVEMRGISKSFGEVHAVREGEFTLKKGGDTLADRRKRRWKVDDDEASLWNVSH